MKKLLFAGVTAFSDGVCLMNRKFVGVLPAKLFRVQKKAPGIARRLEFLVKMALSRKIVVSGLSVKACDVKLAKLLNKKVVYIMHGNAWLETGREHPAETALLKHSDLILCVSEWYAGEMRKAYPQYASKIDALYNGINWEFEETLPQRLSTDQVSRKVVLFGGGRIEKGNLEVCRAVQSLVDAGDADLKVDVYGEMRVEDFSREIASIPCVSFHNLVTPDQVGAILGTADVFVANSSRDTFNVAVAEALMAGCSVLISESVGIKTLIPSLSESDIIKSTRDVEEIKEKIKILLDCPNNRRLLDSMDRDATSMDHWVSDLVSKVDKL